MTREEILEQLKFENDRALFADGFEDALIGIARQFSKSLALYDKDKCIQILMERDGMTQEDAEAFFSFNTQGAWVGENTPVFAELITEG